MPYRNPHNTSIIIPPKLAERRGLYHPVPVISNPAPPNLNKTKIRLIRILFLIAMSVFGFVVGVVTMSLFIMFSPQPSFTAERSITFHPSTIGTQEVYIWNENFLSLDQSSIAVAQPPNRFISNVIQFTLVSVTLELTTEFGDEMYLGFGDCLGKPPTISSLGPNKTHSTVSRLTLTLNSFNRVLLTDGVDLCAFVVGTKPFELKLFALIAPLDVFGIELTPLNAMLLHGNLLSAAKRTGWTNDRPNFAPDDLVCEFWSRCMMTKSGDPLDPGSVKPFDDPGYLRGMNCAAMRFVTMKECKY